MYNEQKGVQKWHGRAYISVTLQYLSSKVKHMYVVDSDQFVFVRLTTITAVYSNVWKGNKKV